MSDSNPPFDPFGRSERTVIRPNPAGRRQAPQASSSAPSQASSVTSDEWIATSVSQASAQGTPARPLAVNLAQLGSIGPHKNPIMRAAGPLLLLFGRLRVEVSHSRYADLMQEVAAAIEDFERQVRSSGLSAEQTKAAKYILCATADDIVQNIPDQERHVWTQHSMLSRIFGERIGGVRFFEELDKAKADPMVNYQVLELIHACLALGFQGIHRTSAGGAAALQQIQRNLYETLRRVQSAEVELSPRWQGKVIPLEPVRMLVPAWAIGSVAAVLLLGIYLAMRAVLSGESDAVSATLVAMHPTGEIGIQRRVFQTPPPPPPTQQGSRFRAALGPPLEVEESGNVVTVRLSGLSLFAPASATLEENFKPLITKIASLLEKEPGTVKVVGHTDAAPVRSVRFPSNFHLSLERARSVAELIKGQVTKPDRITIEGKGADVPIASNKTVDGRARNRRVEILIQRTN
jgi:type VI secretion system protein ImpK